MNIKWVGANSANYQKGRSGVKVDLIVVHHMVGTMASTDATFQDPKRQASATYGVGRNGDIHQYVKEEDTSYNAGNLDINRRSISIEHEDLAKDDFTDLEYRTSAQLIKEIAQRHGIPIDSGHIKPHKAFKATACPGNLDINKLISLAKGATMSNPFDTIVPAAAVTEIYSRTRGVAPKPSDPDYKQATSDRPLSFVLDMLTEAHNRGVDEGKQQSGSSVPVTEIKIGQAIKFVQ